MSCSELFGGATDFHFCLARHSDLDSSGSSQRNSDSLRTHSTLPPCYSSTKALLPAKSTINVVCGNHKLRIEILSGNSNTSQGLSEAPGQALPPHSTIFFYHRATEPLRLEGISRGHLCQPPRPRQGQLEQAAQDHAQLGVVHF